MVNVRARMFPGGIEDFREELEVSGGARFHSHEHPGPFARAEVLREHPQAEHDHGPVPR